MKWFMPKLFPKLNLTDHQKLMRLIFVIALLCPALLPAQQQPKPGQTRIPPEVIARPPHTPSPLHV
jgi:hypothetical protein